MKLIECPICNYKVSSFDSYRGRINARCPGCGVMERHRLLWLYLRDELKVGSTPIRILDIAHMEPMAERLRAMPKVNYITLDRDPDRWPDITNNVENMVNVPDSSFDLILCSHVLEHVEDDRKALSELHRIIQPGGILLVMVPWDPSKKKTVEAPGAGPAERRRRFGDPAHVRMYGRDISRRIEDAGFSVEMIRYGARIKREKAKRHAIDTSEELWVAAKRRQPGRARATGHEESQRPASGLPAGASRPGARRQGRNERMAKRKSRKEILEMFARRAQGMIDAYPPRTANTYNLANECVQQEPEKVFELAKVMYVEKPISSVLDLGCGIGRWFRFWVLGVGAKKITGIEPVEALALEADRRFGADPSIEIIMGELSDLDNRSTKDGGLGRRSWDLGFTFTVLGHVPPSEIKETADILKKRTKRLMLIEPVQGDCFCDFTFRHDYQKLFGRPKFQRMVDRWKAVMIF